MPPLYVLFGLLAFVASLPFVPVQQLAANTEQQPLLGRHRDSGIASLAHSRHIKEASQPTVGIMVEPSIPMTGTPLYVELPLNVRVSPSKEPTAPLVWLN